MAGENEDIEIELSEEGKTAETPEVEIVKAETKPDENKPDPLEEQLQALRSQVDNERKGRIDAEKRAHEASSTAVQYQSEVRDSELGQISAAIETVKQSLEVLKVNYRSARSENDIEAELSAQMEMSRQAAVLLQLENGKQALESAPKIEAPAPYRPSDPVEALASQLSPRSADWVRQHPEYARDQRLYSKMLAAHNLAMADGLPADSDDYFDAIEDTLKIRQRAPEVQVDAMADAAKTVQRRQSPAAAPVSRGGNAQGSSSNRVTLSAAEIETAEIMGMTPQEYAKNKLALQREGKLN